LLVGRVYLWCCSIWLEQGCLLDWHIYNVVQIRSRISYNNNNNSFR
jgi:hypothetical protein